MTSQYGPFGLVVPDRADAAKGPDNFRALVDSLTPYLGSDNGITAGSLAARPAATGANANSLYIANDGLNAGRAFLSTGSAWIELAVNLRLTRILATVATETPLRVTGASGQTAALIEALNNGGSTVFGVSSVGAVSAASVTTTGGVTGTGLVSSSAGLGLPSFATASLPAAGPIGMLVYDTTVSQVKVKTASATATYSAVGAGSVQKAQGTYTQNNTNGRAITVGFAPDLVMVSSTSGAFGWLHRTETAVSQSQFQGQFVANEYLTASGFVVGGDTTTVGRALNGNASTTYYWTAFKFV